MHMAEIQAALPARFLQVAHANKASQNGVETRGVESGGFLGVLKAQFLKPESTENLLGIELAGDSLEKPDFEKPDLAPAVLASELPVASDASSASLPVPVDPALQAAAMATSAMAASIRGAVTVPKAALAQAQESESELGGVDLVGEAREKSKVQIEPEALSKPKVALDGKPGGAANVANAGQALPLGAQAVRSESPLPAGVDAKALAATETVAASTFGARAEGNAAQPIVVPHHFEQVLRQAEAKVNASIESPVRSPAFANELGEKVVWLAGRQGQLADLSLNPPQMGALEVRLTVSGGEATAQFFSANPLVRDAIDAALPRLRELMAQAGLNLGEAEVRDQAFGRREPADARPHSSAPSQDDETGSHQAVLAGIGGRQSSGIGLVDLYI
jgi:flagellar hook-length control protein FliK